MTTEQMNREVAEWLGICWHDPDPNSTWETMFLCKHCGKKMLSSLIAAGKKGDVNHDLSQGAGIIRLLEEMQARWPGFMLAVGKRKYANGINGPISDYIETSYITIPGKLLQAVYEWSKEHPR